MPEFGLRTIAEADVPDLARFPALPWALNGAAVAQVTFEVDLEATLDLLPAQLSRPVPPYARLIVSHFTESPFGPYVEALLLLACRYRMEPKQYPISCVVTNVDAQRAYEAIWGFETRAGRVELQRTADPATGAEEITAVIGADEPLASLRLPAAYAIEPAMIRYDPFVGVRTPAGGEPEVFQFSGTPAIHTARLAKGATLTCQTDAWADPWFRLRSLNMISATFAIADLQRTEPVVQPLRPAGGGGGGLP